MSESERFEDRSLLGAVFKNCAMANTLFEDIDLSDARYCDVNMQRVRLQNVNLAGASIEDANIEGLTVAGHDLQALIRNHQAGLMAAGLADETLPPGAADRVTPNREEDARNTIPKRSFDYLLLMHSDAADAAEPEAWSRYFTSLREIGALQGGSEIGTGETIRKSGAPGPTGKHLSGYIRVRAESLSAAKALVIGNPVYEAGGSIEVRELPVS